MTTETRRKLEQEFNALPLEQKFSTLFRMEASTLEEAFTYVVNSTMKAAEKAGETMKDLGAQFEVKVDKEWSKAKKAADDYQAPKAKPKGPAPKGPGPKPSAKKRPGPRKPKP
jgi:hypothetical protein